MWSGFVWGTPQWAATGAFGLLALVLVGNRGPGAQVRLKALFVSAWALIATLVAPTRTPDATTLQWDLRAWAAVGAFVGWVLGSGFRPVDFGPRDHMTPRMRVGLVVGLVCAALLPAAVYFGGGHGPA